MKEQQANLPRLRFGATAIAHKYELLQRKAEDGYNSILQATASDRSKANRKAINRKRPQIQLVRQHVLWPPFVSTKQHQINKFSFIFIRWHDDFVLFTKLYCVCHWCWRWIYQTSNTQPNLLVIYFVFVFAGRIVLSLKIHCTNQTLSKLVTQILVATTKYVSFTWH